MSIYNNMEDKIALVNHKLNNGVDFHLSDACIDFKR